MKHALYRALNTITGDSYIGISCNYKARKAFHRYDAFTNFSQTHFHRALRKYGWDAFSWSVICETRTRSGVMYLEQIAVAVGMGNYNMTRGGEGSPGLKKSQAWVQNLISHKTGSRHSDESRAKMRAAKLGTALSSTHRAKIKAALTGKTIPPEVRLKMSIAAQRREQRKRESVS